MYTNKIKFVRGKIIRNEIPAESESEWAAEREREREWDGLSLSI